MDMFYALAEPTRREIIEMLAKNGQLSATDISEKFPVSPPAISQHLKVLREANMVRMKKQAQRRLYQINPQAMRELEKWAKEMTKLWKERFDSLDKLLNAENAKARKYGRDT
jgi:DNA-binding transcriptional ArsR family regulator